MNARRKAAGQDFEATFDRLREILRRYEPRLTVVEDEPASYSLNAGYSERWKKVMFFGAVRQGKRYVSYYLMPLYMFPELLEGLPARLESRLEGKACFNFTALGPAELAALRALTAKCMARFEKEGLAPHPK